MEIEPRYVYSTYSHIARSFSSTRIQIWSVIKDFLDQLANNSLVLDAGCGNGKNMLAHNKLNFIGCDTCPEFVRIATSKNLQVILANILALPFANNKFDHIISIAVIHHIYQPGDRIKAINELLRVVKPGGTILISVWSRNVIKPHQMGRKFKLLKPDSHDYLVTWQKQRERYYHMFDLTSFTALLSGIDNCQVIKIFEADNNLYAIISKR